MTQFISFIAMMTTTEACVVIGLLLPLAWSQLYTVNSDYSEPINEKNEKDSDDNFNRCKDKERGGSQTTYRNETFEESLIPLPENNATSNAEGKRIINTYLCRENDTMLDFYGNFDISNCKGKRLRCIDDVVYLNVTGLLEFQLTIIYGDGSALVINYKYNYSEPINGKDEDADNTSNVVIVVSIIIIFILAIFFIKWIRKRKKNCLRCCRSQML